MNRFSIICKYLLHFFTARNTGGFGVHSPFLFQFTRFVLFEKHSFYNFKSIEKVRKYLKNDKKIIDLTDFGTRTNRRTTVASIASKSLKSAKYGQLLFRMVRYFKAINILELGTSLGITTSYLASSTTEIKCVSLEGCPQIVAIAQENFEKLGIKNIEIVVGNIDETLHDAIQKFESIDFIFIDANHQYDAVLNYFEMCLPKISCDSIIIIDDIYWSKEMEKAWKMIKNHPSVTSTIDLFQLGIVFFNGDLHKKHYKMRY